MIDWWYRPVTAAEEAAVVSFMTRAASAPRRPILRDPDVLWLRARLLRRWEAELTVQTPLDLIEPVQLTAALAAALLVLRLVLPSLLRLLASISA